MVTIPAAVLIVAVCIVAWALVFYLRPAVASAKFEQEMTAIRDAVFGAVITEQIADSPSARALVQRADVLRGATSEISLSTAFAAFTSVEDPGPHDDFLTCSEADRAFLVEQDDLLVEAMREYLMRGSKAWWATGLVFALLRKRALRAHSTHVPRRPADIAEGFSVFNGSPSLGRRMQAVH